MNRALIGKIPTSEIRKYVKSTRNSNFMSTGFVLLPRTGAVTLDFSKTSANFCTINFRRDSGNGFILANYNGSGKEYQIASKTSQLVSFDLSNDKIIQLNRTPRSRGNVIILDISLYGEDTSIDWNNELKKSKDYNCLRLVGSELYASEGAYIKGTGITVKTEPPNACSTDGDCVKFNISCKVTYLNILKQEIEPIQPIKPSGTVIFDTKISGFSSVYCNNYASATSGGVILDHRGSYTIPLSTIKSGQTYIVHITMSRIDGNGKIMFGIIPGEDISKFVTVSNSSGKDFTLHVKSALCQQGYSVSIWRHHSATGRVKIDNITIESLNDVDNTALMRDLIDGPHIELVSSFPYYQTQHPVIKQPIIFSDGSLGLYRDEILNNAVLEATNPSYKFGNIKISLKPRTWSANNWVSKFCNFVEGVTVDSLQIKGSTLSQEEDSVLITDIYNLVPSRRILLEEFMGALEPSMLEKLRMAEFIGTPSLMNAQLLRYHFGNKVTQVPKYWPVFDVAPKQDDSYDLLICRDPVITRDFVQRYQAGSSKKLIVIGYRGTNLPVIFYDEFIPYQQLLSLILYADTIIDFPKNIHYYSGLLDLAFSANKNIITTNHWMNISKPKVTVIDSIIGPNGLLIPDMQAAISALESQTLKQNNLDLDTYNNNLLGTLRILEVAW
jgi:hypothetical protein